MQKLTLTIRRGATVDLPIRVESDTWVYKAITGMAQSAPVRITAVEHGLKDGWRAAVMNAKGMTDLNAANNPPKDSELRRATRVSADAVEFNGVNAAAYRAYTSGGQLAYRAPLDLATFVSARMQVKDKVGGTALATFSTTDATLELDATTQTLWLRLTDEVTALYTFDRGVFDIELVDASGAVTAVCSADSTLTVLPEVTTE